MPPRITVDLVIRSKMVQIMEGFAHYASESVQEGTTVLLPPFDSPAWHAWLWGIYQEALERWPNLATIMSGRTQFDDQFIVENLAAVADSLSDILREAGDQRRTGDGSAPIDQFVPSETWGEIYQFTLVAMPNFIQVQDS